MHAVFMLYGKQECVDMLLRDIGAQKYLMKFYKDDTKQEESLWIDGQIRTLPFGIYEHVFPKEYADNVLSTLRFNDPAPYNMGEDFKLPFFKLGINLLKLLRKFLQLEEIPKDFKTESKFVWMMNHVAVVPIGVRYDTDILDPWGPKMGWRHEGI